VKIVGGSRAEGNIIIYKEVTLDELQADLDTWLKEYNESRPHSGKYCFGKTPMQTFRDSLSLAKEKMLNQTVQTSVATA
jgi:hypothetical protein